MATLEAVPEKQSRRSGIVEFRQLSRTGTVRTLTLGESAGDHQPSPEVALDDWIVVARWRASGSPALQSSPGVNTVWQLAYREMQSRCAIPYQPRFRFSLTGALPSPPGSWRSKGAGLPPDQRPFSQEAGSSRHACCLHPRVSHGTARAFFPTRQGRQMTIMSPGGASSTRRALANSALCAQVCDGSPSRRCRAISLQQIELFAVDEDRSARPPRLGVRSPILEGTEYLGRQVW